MSIYELLNNPKILRFNQKVKKKVPKTVWSVIRFLLLFGLSFMILYPLIVKFSTSIKSTADLNDATVMFIPKEPTWENYQLITETIDYGKSLLYTIGLGILTSVLQCVSCAMVAYGLARFNFKLRGLLMGCVIFTLVVPPQSILIPLFFRFRFLNIFNIFTFTGSMSGINVTDTIIPFILLSLTATGLKNGLYIYMFRQYFKNIPVVLEEAAYIDGCSNFKTFWRIIMPGASSILISVFLFAFVWQWTDRFYTDALASTLPTLSNKLFNMTFSQLDATFNSILNAKLVNAKFYLLVFPLIILYIFAQRFFTESIEQSGIVG